LRVKRRCLHAGASAAWLAGATLLIVGMQTDSHVVRLLLIFTLTVAATLTSAAILVALLAPMPAVYRSGFRDGVESSSPPKLTVVRGVVGDQWF
jgi:hypothetical protein